MDIRELLAERAKLHEENKAALDVALAAKRGLNTEEQSAYDKRTVRMSEITKIKTLVEETEAEERALAESRGRKTETVVATPKSEGVSSEDQVLAFRGWAMGRHATPEMREAAARCGIDIQNPTVDMASQIRLADGKPEVRVFQVRASGSGDIEKRALSIGTTTAGGNSVPNEMMRAYLEVQKWFAQVEEQAEVVNTETGATLPWPTVSDTANTGRVLAEATAATTTTDPTFGVVNLGAFKLSSDAVLVSWELAQDSFIDLAGYLGKALGRRIGRIKSTKFTVGAGTTEPKGFIPGGTVGVTAGATNAFTVDDVISLIHSLDKAYRGLPDTGFQVHDTIAAVLRKFKDGTGRYIWEMSAQLGQPDRLFGFPVSINNDMSSALTTGQKLLAFCNLKAGFIVRKAGATRFVRDDSIYVAQHQIYFEAIERADSNVVDTTAIKILALG